MTDNIEFIERPNGCPSLELPLLSPSQVESISSQDYSGVVVLIGDDYRVAVGRKGNRYHLQKRARGAKNDLWLGNQYAASASSLLRLYAHKVPGLSDAMAGLPENPALAAPETVALAAAQAAAFNANDWRLDAYARVVAVCEDWRLTVDADDSRYRVMFIHRDLYLPDYGCDCWITAFASPDLSDVVRWCEAGKGLTSDLWHSTPEKLVPFFADLPPTSLSGLWPDLPSRPLPVAAVRS